MKIQWAQIYPAHSMSVLCSCFWSALSEILPDSRSVVDLPAHTARAAFEGPFEIVGHPAAIEATRLRRDGFVTDETGVHGAGVDGQMVADRFEGRCRIWIAPRGPTSDGIAGPDALVVGDALPLAETLPRRRLQHAVAEG